MHSPQIPRGHSEQLFLTDREIRIGQNISFYSSRPLGSRHGTNPKIDSRSLPSFAEGEQEVFICRHPRLPLGGHLLANEKMSFLCVSMVKGA
jgi:hypothetical protein